jgi:50S ribosomal subunit-associated GTPase HflX
VDAFRATLEEAASSTLLLHIVDACAEDRAINILRVNEVLKEIGAHDLPSLMIYNKIDQLKDVDTITINNPGASVDDFTEFEYGVDFFDGRLESDHSRPYDNLEWDQYRWDNKNAYYYVNENGELVVRINQAYKYDASQIVT